MVAAATMADILSTALCCSYASLASSPKLLDTSVPDNQVLADYISTHSPVSITTDGRIANCYTDASPLCPPMPLRILHINDPHARIEPADSNFNLAAPASYSSSYGGVARIAGYVAAARAQAAAAGQDILVLHGGDQYQGTPWHSVYTRPGNHTPMWNMLNPIGFDAMVGGHGV